jgi:A/G-specific adenine glycosylase
MTAFRATLLAWFAEHERDLPWRRTRDPYRIWVSEVMLQQTQVSTVIPYFLRFVAKFPDVCALSGATLEDVLKIWENLGYYGRARNLHRAAQKIMEDFGGIFPREHAVLRSLPGVGEYIAAAVASIAYGEPRAVVDGNVRRVLARLFLIDGPSGGAPAARVFRERAQEILDRSNPGEFNQAMMELGALVCTPRSPSCGECPVASHCGAFAASLQTAYPARIKRPRTPQYRIAVGVVRKDERFLITRRKESGLLGGLWELPGGKIEPGETPGAACIREIAEEVNLSVEVKDFVARISHAYSHFRVVADVFECEYKTGEVILNGPIDHRWILLEEADAYPFPALNHKIFPHLAKSKPRTRPRAAGTSAGAASAVAPTRRGNRLKNRTRS